MADTETANSGWRTRAAIGGGLVALALIPLVCSQWPGRGPDETTQAEIPAVSAPPPVEPMPVEESVGLAGAGAGAGSEVAPPAGDGGAAASAAVAGVAAGSGAPAPSTGSSTSKRRSAPAVSAGPPPIVPIPANTAQDTPVAAASAAPAAAPPAVLPTGAAGVATGVAGRFDGPDSVDLGPDVAAALNTGTPFVLLNDGPSSPLRPCDNPGVGCVSVQASAAPPLPPVNPSEPGGRPMPTPGGAPPVNPSEPSCGRPAI